MRCCQSASARPVRRIALRGGYRDRWLSSYWGLKHGMLMRFTCAKCWASSSGSLGALERFDAKAEGRYRSTRDEVGYQTLNLDRRSPCHTFTQSIEERRSHDRARPVSVAAR